MSGDDDLPRLLGGRYRLESLLGKGGMGVVYRGVDLVMKRPVAVKLVIASAGIELDEELAGRFLREAKNTARLQHENIVEVFDLGRTDEGALYFVMEFISGHSLSSRLRKEGQLSVATTVHIGRQICSALQVAHTAGVIHRDLKPANIMLLSRAGDDDFVKVLDFGVSKSLEAAGQDTQLTHTGMLVGTVDYMAPEQIMGQPVDGRTDVYALGIVLYRMLSGKAPFGDVAVPALMHAHLNTMPKPLIEVAPAVPNALDHVILRCLAKKPEHRFESMGELARALKEASMPRTSGLLDLEYNADSDEGGFDDGQATVARPVDDGALPETWRPNADLGPRGRVLSFNDATVRIDNPHVKRASASAPPPRGVDEATRVAMLYPKACTACHTMNQAHIHVCRGCGAALPVLAPSDGGRARVPTNPPRTVRTSSPGFDRGIAAVAPPPGGAASSQTPRGFDSPSPVHDASTVVPRHPPAAPAKHEPTSSIWQRFLAWSGLRGR